MLLMSDITQNDTSVYEGSVPRCFTLNTLNDVNPSLQFYARDEYEESEVTQVHPLESLVLARYLRLQFRTDVLSIGNDTKCLRLEILGCPASR